MFMFVMFSVLAFQGQLKIVDPVFHIDNISAQQCVELLKKAEKELDLTQYEVRCVKLDTV